MRNLVPFGVASVTGNALADLPEGIPHSKEVVVELERPDAKRVEGAKFVDDILFKTALDRVAVPPAETHSLPPPNSMPRKLWVWSTENQLQDASARAKLFNLCESQRIDELWMQLLYDVTRRDTEPPSAICELRYQAEFRQLLHEAHERGLRVHALDGDPDFALRENHHLPLAILEAILAFNHAGPANACFDGVHFDNEPYLLVGWHNPTQRVQILRDFLTLNAECQRRIRERSEMLFGIDIPFWRQSRDETTGQIVGEVEFAGKRQAASFHCLDMLDQVGVMNYRDAADGPDGMIAHGRELLDYADRHGRAVVMMGVETFRNQPTPVWFAAGVPRARFHTILETRGERIARLSRLNGMRLRTLDDGERVSLGIELPHPLTRDAEQLAEESMIEIARTFGIRDPSDESAAAMARLSSVIEKDAQWCNMRARSIVDSTASTRYAGFLLDNTMVSKITFADDSVDHFQTQVRAAEQYFRRYKSYAGTAIHCYETFCDKLQQR